MTPPAPAPAALSALRPAHSELFFDERLGVAPSLRLPKAITRSWAYGDGSGRGVRVAVLDSGIDGSHPLVGGVAEYVAVDLAPAAAGEAPSEVRFTPGPHDDVYGHGTACAGIIRELAPEVELVSVRVLGPDLFGSTKLFAYGLDWCLEHGVQVASLSLSTHNEAWAPAFWDLVDQACYRNMMVVSAMNNEPKRTIPSEYAGVFSVACGPGTDRERVWCRPDGPAQWGAAGIEVPVAELGGGTMVATGNSFATPVVAGHLARIVGAHPGITVWQAKTVLAQLAENRPRPAAGGRAR